ncbi:Dual specificity protein phosphatase 23 [Leucoagaricus sp. SymC.cos]|nr:Dual specificity protein phosphatase 23 [Leucoagaricus sp. SymC.cos]
MDASICEIDGTWALTGPSVDETVREAIQTHPHLLSNRLNTAMPYRITLVAQDEMERLSCSALNPADGHLPPDRGHIFSAGIGGRKDGVLFIVIVWVAGQRLRKQLELPPTHFYIPLTAQDNHNIDRGISSLLPSQTLPKSQEFLDHSSYTSFILSQYSDARKMALELMNVHSESQKGFLRFADACFALGDFKNAMLAYAQAYDHLDGSEKLQSYCIKRIVECSQKTEWGAVFQDNEKHTVPSGLLLSLWSKSLRETLGDQQLPPSLSLESRKALFVPIGLDQYYKLPRFFRWIVPFQLAIMSTPRYEEDIDALASPHIGIRHVLTLTEETPLPSSWFKNKPITNTFLPVSNYHPPSIEQMDIIIQLLEDNKKMLLLVHCGGGKGRAGTVIACYLATFGFMKPSFDISYPKMAASDAISTLCSIRPGSIETSQQEAFVSEWCSTIWKRRSVYPDRPSEPPPCHMEVQGSLSRAQSNFFVLVGLPGSGKSWFSRALAARASQDWSRISQDEIGSRSQCESAISRGTGSNFTILDRCNMSDAERKEWLKLASNWAQSPMRVGHPTLPPGGRVRNAILQMRNQFIEPKLSEGFSAIIRIKSFEAVQELVHFLVPPSDHPIKFPRTAHLIDVGGATPDDIVSSDYTLANSVPCHVIVTEKIDGANMGISLSPDRSRIMVQNRSHWVNPTSHEQFKKLGKWLEEHRSELYEILDRDEFYAERYILYGEWMYATHSIPYTHLSDVFVAFDLFDRSTSQFVDRTTLDAMLRGTSITLVPLICELKDQLPSRNELLKLIETKSRFYEGKVEGVVIKVENNGIVRHRGKVVRGDFITGNEHWTKGPLRLNGIQSNESLVS